MPTSNKMRNKLFKGPKKGQNRFVVKATWNDKHCICHECLHRLIDYSIDQDLAEIPDLDMSEFYVPADWFLANEKIGCPHGLKKILKSVYEEKTST